LDANYLIGTTHGLAIANNWFAPEGCFLVYFALYIYFIFLFPSPKNEKGAQEMKSAKLFTPLVFSLSY
jgi:hypothetical protein